mmetsp:Transcript_11158/g.35439  ORF Transcript_11158/g.35439 Transcript_11158/m.35439 type:complete len:738 (+) Transcript_11158:62-2275(+)
MGCSPSKEDAVGAGKAEAPAFIPIVPKAKTAPLTESIAEDAGDSSSDVSLRQIMPQLTAKERAAQLQKKKTTTHWEDPFTAKDKVEVAVNSGDVYKGVTIIYASQTGTCADIAGTIHGEMFQNGIKSRLAAMDELAFKDIGPTTTPVIIFVAATTGVGEVPDHAKAFMTDMRMAAKPSVERAGKLLAGCSYTVLGLGDSDYTASYMVVPRTVIRNMDLLGAKQFHEHGEADDNEFAPVPRRTVVDKWFEDLMTPLMQAIADVYSRSEMGTTSITNFSQHIREARKASIDQIPQARITTVIENNKSKCSEVLRKEADALRPETIHKQREKRKSTVDANTYSHSEPFLAGKVDAKYLVTADHHNKALLLTMDTSESKMQIEAGDTVGILPRNRDDVVEQVISLLRLKGDMVFSVVQQGLDVQGALVPHIKCPCSVKHALTRYVDISGVPKRSVLRTLSYYCRDSSEKVALMELARRDSSAATNLIESTKSTGLLSILKRFPSCKPPLNVLLDVLPTIAPREFSVANDPRLNHGKVDICFTVVREKLAGGTMFNGLCTGFLDDVVGPAASATVLEPIPLFRSSTYFRPPATCAAPLIMVCAGTGIASFRGFLQRRRHELDGQPAPAPCHLFFGVRDKEHLLFQSELEGYKADGTLTELHVAFSRQGGSFKQYVQDVIEMAAEEMGKLILEHAAKVFVVHSSRNAHAMGSAVHSAIEGCVCKAGGMTKPAAQEYRTPTRKP